MGDRPLGNSISIGSPGSGVGWPSITNSPGQGRMRKKTRLPLDRPSYYPGKKESHTRRECPALAAGILTLVSRNEREPPRDKPVASAEECPALAAGVVTLVSTGQDKPVASFPYPPLFVLLMK